MVRVERTEGARLVEVLLRERLLYDETEGTEIEEPVEVRSVPRVSCRWSSGFLAGGAGVGAADAGLQTCWSATERGQT
jgi:hypothetical protein